MLVWIQASREDGGRRRWAGNAGPAGTEVRHTLIFLLQSGLMLTAAIKRVLSPHRPWPFGQAVGVWEQWCRLLRAIKQGGGNCRITSLLRPGANVAATKPRLKLTALPLFLFLFFPDGRKSPKTSLKGDLIRAWRRCRIGAFWCTLDVTATPCGSCMCVPVEVLLPAEIHRDQRELSQPCCSCFSSWSQPSWDTRWWPMNWQPVTGASACQFCRPLLRLSPPTSASGDVDNNHSEGCFVHSKTHLFFFITLHTFYWIMLRKHELNSEVISDVLIKRVAGNECVTCVELRSCLQAPQCVHKETINSSYAVDNWSIREMTQVVWTFYCCRGSSDRCVFRLVPLRTTAIIRKH